MIAVLTGGTGGAKLIEGLAAEVDPSELTIICNTGDDCVFHGLNISPDIDTILYTLAGLADTEKGWGVKGDTFTALEQLRRLGNDAWFNLGDKDLAMHITRTKLLREGLPLSAVTERLCLALGVRAMLVPMSDQTIESRVTTPRGEISFQEFFVKGRWAAEVTAVRFAGAEQSRPAPGVIEAIQSVSGIIICPSNPITSIGPILAVPGIRAALEQVTVPVVAVSPLIGKAAISGPAHKLMTACGFEATALGVAQKYRGLLKTLLIDHADRKLAAGIEELGVDLGVTDIRMPTLADKRRLAREVLAEVRK
ncbi:MAG: 2-phospho-L-lactate transferase [Deltaproteobacteria bacterium]|nr:2-phospho-L-lactate transferase [Deltaproteobacteria bacterium]